MPTSNLQRTTPSISMNSNSIRRPMESCLTFEQQLENVFQEGWMPEKLRRIFHHFYEGFQEAVYPTSPEEFDPWFEDYLQEVKKQILNPYTFPPYHEEIRSPFD